MTFKKLERRMSKGHEWQNQEVSKEVNIAVKVTIAALILFYLADGINKILYVNGFSFARVSIFIRLIFEVVFVGIILIFINKYRLGFLKFFLVSFLTFLIGHTSYYFFFKLNLIESFITFNKYYFAFIIYFAIYKLVDHPDLLKKILKVYELIFLLNALLIVCGFIFNIHLFESYWEVTHRFGYNGLITAQNEATLFYLLGLSYFYYNYELLKERPFKLIFVLLVGILIGTKGIYFFIILLLLVHFLLIKKLYKHFFTNIFYIISLIIILNYFLFVTPPGKKIIDYFLFFWNKNGFLSMLLSGRNNFIESKFIPTLSSWSVINYLFGGQDQHKSYMEMDLFDIFLFFGILGSLLYLVLYFVVFFDLKKYSIATLTFIFSFLLLGLSGGHFFASAVNSLYLALFFLFIKSTIKHPNYYFQQ